MTAYGLAQQRLWGPLEAVGELPEGGQLHRAAPAGERTWCTWVTNGLRPAADGLELVTYGDDEATWPGGVLVELARLARLPGALQPGQVLDLGGPVDGDASRLSAVLLLPPYFEPEALWEAEEPAGGWLLWACPITAAEREYATMAGVEALEQALIDAALRPAPALDRGDVV